MEQMKQLSNFSAELISSVSENSSADDGSEKLETAIEGSVGGILL